MQPSHANVNRTQSRAEEIANSSSHAVGLLAALIGAPVLLGHAVRRGDSAYIVGVVIFAATIFLLYLASTLYHALPAGKAKRVFRILDHSSIFLLIAGTYTPFSLGVLRGAWGWTLFGLVWFLAVAGVVFKGIGRESHPILSTGLYPLMGWLVVIAVDPMVTKVPLAGLLWLLAGGLFYTAGVAFYATASRLQFGHLVWHLSSWAAPCVTTSPCSGMRPDPSIARTRSLPSQLLGLLGWLLAVFAAGAVGAVASVDAASFYAQLSKPPWAPPAWVFGPVWSALYALMGVAAWLVWRLPGSKGMALGLFGAQLAANALWSWLFFAWHRGALAAVEVLVLLALIVATAVAFRRTSHLAALLLVPYLLWVSFASVLTWVVWRGNPGLL